MRLTPQLRAHLRTYWIAYAILLISLVATSAAYFGHRQYIDNRDRARFTRQGQAAFEQVEAQLQIFITTLKGLRAMYSANANLTQRELERYFRVLRIEDLQQDKGLEGIGVISPVRPEERAAHLAAMRRNYPGYRLNTKSATNQTIFALTYLERLGQGMEPGPVGWDVGQDPIRREALERCLRTGQPAATAKTKILFASKSTNAVHGFVLYLPIFKRVEGSEGATVTIPGIVFCTFDTTKLWGHLLAHQLDGIDLEIYDGEDLTRENLLFDRDGAHHASLAQAPKFQGEINADFFGRRWSFLFYSQAGPQTFFEHGLPFTLFVLGVAGSFLLFGFVCVQVNSRATAERLTRNLQESEQTVRRANQELAQKVAEAEKASKRLWVTLRSIGDAVIATDTEGRVQLMNPVAEQICERTQTRAAGLQIEEVFSLYDTQSRVRRNSDFAQLLQGNGGNKLKPALYVSPSGKEYLLQKRVAPILDASGERTGAVFVYRDVTQERKIEEELLRASKLESIGLLAGGIAHDFNNVLTGIVGNLSLLRETPGLPGEVAERLALLERTAYKARQLTLQLLTFAKGGSPIKQTASVAEVVRDSAEFALRGSNVKPEFDFAGDLCPVEIDTGQMSQVVQNLVINSKQAMPDGGKIFIKAQNCELGKAINLPLPAGKYVRISIRDTGTGIKSEHISKVFDPYFTTKSSGTGLGLATAYSILKRHDGLITVESEWGEGSTFHLYLPASKQAIMIQPSEPQGRVSGSGHILIMDDEPSIRTLLGSILKHFGYTSTAVENGEAVIQEYKRAVAANQPYAAVIMDLTVPGGMGGKEAAAELRRIDPNVRAIVSSGYSNDPVLAEYRKYGFVARVEKPYRLPELAAVLAQVVQNGAR